MAAQRSSLNQQRAGHVPCTCPCQAEQKLQTSAPKQRCSQTATCAAALTAGSPRPACCSSADEWPPRVDELADAGVEVAEGKQGQGQGQQPPPPSAAMGAVQEPPQGIQLAVGVAGLAALPVVGWSEWVLKSTGKSAAADSQPQGCAAAAAGLLPACLPALSIAIQQMAQRCYAGELSSALAAPFTAPCLPLPQAVGCLPDLAGCWGQQKASHTWLWAAWCCGAWHASCALGAVSELPRLRGRAAGFVLRACMGGSAGWHRASKQP